MYKAVSKRCIRTGLRFVNELSKHVTRVYTEDNTASAEYPEGYKASTEPMIIDIKHIYINNYVAHDVYIIYVRVCQCMISEY